MNATSLYVSVSRLVFQNDGNDQNWTDLYRLVPYLRQSLSCTVCGNLLIEPYTPTDCQHHECKLCIGGRKNLKPSCSWCRDYKKYEENIQLRILLQCYKSLCEHIISTPIFHNMQKHSQASGLVNGNNLGSTSLIDIIEEGARFHDDFKSKSGLTKSEYSILPCLYTNSSTQTSSSISSSSSSAVTGGVTSASMSFTSQNITNNNLLNNCGPDSMTMSSTSYNSSSTFSSGGISSAPPQAPIKTVSNGSAMYSVLYADGNKITIKRKTDNEDDLQQKELKNINPYFKKPSSSRSKSLAKRKGCRCGNATPTPGKLTCCGQRCPCYVESKSCVDCKCRGCRNPHRPDGFKVRPHIPELENLDLQLSPENVTNNCLELSMDAYSNNSQDNSSSHSLDSHSHLTFNDNDTMVFSPSGLSSGKFQVVYTTHMPEVTTTLPTILMSDSPTSTNPSSLLARQSFSHINAVFNEEIVNSQDSISDDEESADDERSDVDIDV